MPKRIQKLCAMTLFCCTVFAWQPAHADLQCRVIQSFDDLHDVQVRVRDYPDRRQNGATSNTMRTALADLGGIDLDTALGSIMSARDKAMLVSFLQVAGAVNSRLAQDDLSAARQLLNRPDIIRISEAVATILRNLPCDEQDLGRGVETDSQQIAGLRAFLAGAPPWWTIAAIVGSTGAIWLFLRHRKSQRRRGRRYSANYLTRYESSSGGATGTLLDISGSGAKLRHDPAHQPEIGAHVKLEIEGGLIPARVVWKNPHYSGLRFQRSLPARVVMQVHHFRSDQLVASA